MRDTLTTDYVSRVLAAYLALPQTPARARPYDRRLARSLEQRSLPLPLVQAALLLGTARRSLRSATAVPLAPIRSLAYFLPVIDELLALPPNPAYLDHLQRKLASPLTPSA